MSRSKKNYDVLIDKHGNYDFSAITNAIKGDKGDKGYKGQKGEIGITGGRGLTGDKGEAGGVFNWQGDVGSKGALPLADTDTLGDLYLANDTEIFYVSNGDGTYTELLDLTLVQGDKGEEGEKGNDGLPGLDGGKGQKGDKGQKGIKGNLGPQGHKGDRVKGDKGQKGDHGLPGTDGLDGAKGEDGRNGHVGRKGEPGVDAANPLFTFMGEVPRYSELPPPVAGTAGHTYRVLEDGSYYASDGLGNYIAMPEVSSLKGDKGDGFVYDDFTPEQILSFKGQKGEVGETGEKGLDGKDGDKGDQFDFSDFTEDDKERLKGEKGQKGIEGVPGASQAGPKGQKGASSEYIIYRSGNLFYIDVPTN